MTWKAVGGSREAFWIRYSSGPETGDTPVALKRA